MHTCRHTHTHTHPHTHTHTHTPDPHLCVWLLTGLWHQRSSSGGDTCPPPAALTLMSLTLLCSARRSPCQRECQLVVLERLQWLPFYWWRAVSEALKCAFNILLHVHSHWSQIHLLGGLWTFSSPTGSCSCSGLFAYPAGSWLCVFCMVTQSELLFQKFLDPLSSMLVVGVGVLSFQSKVVCVFWVFSQK